MAQFRVKPLLPEDMDTFVRLYYKSFIPVFDVFYHRAPSDEGFRIMAAERLRGIQKPDVRAFKLADSVTGAMVGAARWDVWEKERTDEDWHADINHDFTFAPEQNGEAFSLMRKTFGEIHRDRMGNRPHICLSVIFVDPAYQGRGLAGLLLDWGTKEADRQVAPKIAPSRGKST
jgi:GNAT superfamily N-acetyltransferase